jgi:hypothetical protein
MGAPWGGGAEMRDRSASNTDVRGTDMRRAARMAAAWVATLRFSQSCADRAQHKTDHAKAGRENAGRISPL